MLGYMLMGMLFDANPFGSGLDVGTMISSSSAFVDMFRWAIAVLIGVMVAVIIVKGVRGTFGGGG